MLRKPLISKNKKAARIALYGSPVLLVLLIRLVIGVLPKGSGVETDWREVDYTEIESVQILRDYLRIDTTPDKGNEIPAAEFLASLLEAEGIEAHVERLGERNANVWAFIEGEDPKAVVLHNHLDVDPIRLPEDWEHDPFGAEIDELWLFGRGAFDMKSVAIAQLMALIELKRSGHRPKRSVMFLGTAAEETDSKLGTRWILHNHPELVERMDVVLTEGGAVEAISLDEIWLWGTEFMQKRFVDVIVCHESEDRLGDLREDALRHFIEGDRRVLLPEVARFFEQYSETRASWDYRKLLSRPEDLLTDPEFHRLPEYLKSMMRNEVAAFPVLPDPDGGYRMRLILHLLPGEKVEDVFEELIPDWMTFGIPYSFEVPHEDAPPSSTEHPDFLTISEVLGEKYPGVNAGPLIVARSATDARFYRAAGIPSFGFTPFLILSTDTMQMTGPGERIVLPAFVEGVDLYTRLVRALAG